MPFISHSEIKKNEKYNKNRDLKMFDNFVSMRHLLFVGGRQEPLVRQETKRKPTGCANPRFSETGRLRRET
jgi:hypothetical protein